ncbi:MAG TPA: acyl-phosphate glycerol 3-phosphate acyltransferase [Gammaproteobacteria bacterium]|jgi:glycerol-3-phosphate acyltransferase PlsY|nr:acyl-phosphate glycerol 3-phosphate acyltransferase [Acidiferrobacteraceae bacterium]MDP6398964.1 glycerol-3-phosphate 1-O-acyltransferase PlsY [Arenicellales bacterium]HCX87571.1 acyl-phosphate glycerol 3-phosphate acyltransferase [Gammaproteobacteria bacterium]MDP6550931.1 glycerol-3-phosphate 1-O-acyltransferase PlsY [Arenicellales bacterium]MDP6790693.1 glycerol-3-phosphate 1-O-acyltransferase PlsY [Arenicellales bacterium]|tara:strand:- start:14784 stop:15368 length:585 start_codon:yes stop_codon:yes gene_type:complete
MEYLIFAIAGYLLGSVSSAVVVSRLMNLPDPRREGSGNPGATNVLRLGNQAAAGLTLAGDILKGALPVLVARWLFDDPLTAALAGAGAFFGHLLPLFFGFKGGKGVATALGVFAALSLPVAGGLALTWLVVALVFRYSSLAALVSAASAPAWTWWILSDPVYTGLAALLALMLVLRHRANIGRLLAGTESKIGK